MRYFMLVMLASTASGLLTRRLGHRATTRFAEPCASSAIINTADALVSDLLQHPAAAGFLPQTSSGQTKLARRHAPLFATHSALGDGTTAEAALFNRLGAACCEAGVVPKKELFECWATALHVHRAFPSAGRVADLCSGHGLLAWMLLALGATAP